MKIAYKDPIVVLHIRKMTRDQDHRVDTRIIDPGGKIRLVPNGQPKTAGRYDGRPAIDRTNDMTRKFQPLVFTDAVHLAAETVGKKSLNPGGQIELYQH